MKLLDGPFNLVVRVVLFLLMLPLVIYIVHFILPVPGEPGADQIALNPALQVGLFLVLALFGALVGFWITFGDLIYRSGR